MKMARAVAREAVRHAKQWQQAAREMTVEAVNLCAHPPEAIIQGRYYSDTVVTLPPFLVCRECGYAEEVWGAGTWKLKLSYTEPEMSRDEAMKLVRVWVDQDDMERLGRYGKDRADPGFSLLNCVRNV